MVVVAVAVTLAVSSSSSSKLVQQQPDETKPRADKRREESRDADLQRMDQALASHRDTVPVAVGKC